MSTKTWTTDADFDVGVVYDNDTISYVTFGRAENELQLSGAWYVAAPMNQARDYLAGCGTEVSALSFGGRTIDDGPGVKTTEEYDGTSWCSSGDLNTALFGVRGCGIVSAALSVGGMTVLQSALTNVEEFGGTVWSVGGNLNTAVYALAVCGTQDSAFKFGGAGSGVFTPPSDVCEEYSGTSWSTVASMLLEYKAHGGCGTPTAALHSGGYSPNPVYTVSHCSEFNGLSWSSANELTMIRQKHVMVGIQTVALAMGGDIATGYNATEEYNGTNWQNCNSDLLVRRQWAGASGSQSNALIFGGKWNNLVDLQRADTYVYSDAPIGRVNFDFDSGSATSGWGNLSWTHINTAWITGGNLNIGRRLLAGAGDAAIAGLSFGGVTGASTERAETEHYDGASWSSGGDLSRAVRQHGGTGTESAALSFGGVDFATQFTVVTEEYGGVAWSSGGDLGVGKYNIGSAGSPIAGLCIGGTKSGSRLATCEEYNGGTWSTTSDLSEDKTALAGAGTQSAGLCIGGSNVAFLSATEEYDGTSWSSGGDLNAQISYHAGAGTQSAALSFGGLTGTVHNEAEAYDGTSWTSVNSMNYTKYMLGGSGAQSSAIAFGGTPDGSTNLATTEEYSIQGTLQARVKSASSQANLDTADYYPIQGWTTGADLNTGRGDSAPRSGFGGCGTKSASLAWGGTFTMLSSCEQYDGTSWCSDASLNVAVREVPGDGSVSAAFSCGGWDGAVTTATEEYNGTCWSVVNSLNVAVRRHGACGTPTAAVEAMGRDASALTGKAEEYDGTSWSTIASPMNYNNTISLPAAIESVAFTGSFTTAIFCGANTTQTFDGTSWTHERNTPSNESRQASFGDSGHAVCFGTIGWEWDGLVWYQGTAPNVSRPTAAGSGSSTSGMGFGGYNAGYLISTEEYTADYYTTQPQDAECPDGRWFRLNLIFTAGSTPIVEEINQNYGEGC